jgi:hypothetical protein
MRNDVQKYVSECEKCQKIKNSPRKVALLQPMRAHKLITMDLTGPLPETSEKNKNILVLCDHFSKRCSYMR